MKVIIVYRAIYGYHGYGGAQRRLYFYAKALSKLGVDVEYISSSLGYVRELKIEGVKFKFMGFPIVYFQPILGFCGSYLFSPTLESYLKREAFDILHTPEVLFYTFKNNRKPMVFEVHDLECLYDIDILKLSVKKLYYSMVGYYSLLKRSIKYAEVITVENSVQYKELVNFCKDAKGKVACLPMGIELTTISEIIEGGVSTRRELGFAEDDFIIISVNRFEKHKGLDYLIKAFQLIKQEIGNAKLVLIGSPGPYLPNILKKIHELRLSSDVKLLTSIAYRELINYYAISNVYVCPLLIGSTSNSILEAMACGLPIVSTIMPWLVYNDVNGYIVPKANAEAIALAILKIYDKGVCKTFGKASREIVKEYDWKNIAKKALSIYEKLI